MKNNRNNLLPLLALLFSIHLTAQQNVGIGTTTPDPSAALDIKSTDKGVLVPRMTTAERNAIASPAPGLLVFDITTNGFWFADGTTWKQVPVAYTAGTGISIAGNAITNTGDVSNTNELNTAFTFNGSGNLSITDAGGTKTVNLSGLNPLESDPQVGDDNTYNYLPKWNGLSLVKSTSVFEDNNGKVGIGKDNPVSPLDVQGETRTIKLTTTSIAAHDNGVGNRTINMYGGTTGDQWINFRTGGNPTGHAGLIFSDHSSEHFFLYNSGVGLDFKFSTESSDDPDVNDASAVTRLSIRNSDGNVGIGTTDPGYKLEVNGGLRVNEAVSVGGEHPFGVDAPGASGGRFLILSTGQAGFRRTYSDASLNVHAQASDTQFFRVEKPDGNSVLEVQNDGEVAVSGNFFVVNGSKDFIMDHPLDPANKSLRHACVESNEVLNVYSGTVTLDAQGKASVSLPDYFEALNKDFRYSLTAVGSPAPNLYISKEVSGNQFEIAGGAPGAKVSWQVTGVRNDPWFRDHPYRDVQEKTGKDKGRYYYPEGYGQPAEKSLQRHEDEEAGGK
jgi:hypothetical protein